MIGLILLWPVVGYGLFLLTLKMNKGLKDKSFRKDDFEAFGMMYVFIWPIMLIHLAFTLVLWTKEHMQ